MILSFFCRLAADFALYFAFANYVLLFSSYEKAAFLWPMAFLLAAGLLSYLLKTTRGGSLPSSLSSSASPPSSLSAPLSASASLPLSRRGPFLLPLLLPCLLFLPATGGLVLLVTLPPWAYLAYILYHNQEQLSYSHCHDRFFRGLKLLPLLALPPLFSFSAEVFLRFQNLILPFVILHLFCGVLSLRLSRHRPEALRRKSARLVNFLLILSLCLLCLSFVYSQIWVLALRGLGLVYRLAVAPVLMLLAMAVALPFFAFGLLIRLLAEKRPPGEESAFSQELGEMMHSSFGDSALFQFPAAVRYAVSAFLLLAFLWAAWLLFRRLLAPGRRIVSVPAIAESRRKLDPAAGQRLDLLLPGDPRQAVRFYYRKFLRLLKKLGVEITPEQTSRDIGALAAGLLQKKAALPKETGGESLWSQETAGLLQAPQTPQAMRALEDFRQLYLPARYDESGGRRFRQEDADGAKALYKLLKKAFTGKANVQ